VTPRLVVTSLVLLLLTVTSVWAVTAYQEVIVTVNTVSTGSCGSAPNGAAASLVTEAGFATCAQYNDFTTQMPNSVGTGLPVVGSGIGTTLPTQSGNWIDCNDDSNSSALWADYNPYPGGNGPLCPVDVHQAVDSVSGQYALSWDVTTTDQNNGGGAVGFTSCGGQSNCYAAGYYVEVKFRFTGNYTGDGQMNIWNQSDFSGSTPPPCYGNSSQVLEVDFIEFDGNPPETNTHLIAANGCNESTSSGSRPYPWNENDARYANQYNIIGLLETHDGNDNFGVVNFWNGNNVYQYGTYYTNPGFSAMRNNLFLTFSGFGPGHGPYSIYIAYVKVWTCSGWKVSATSTCAGTGGYDSSNGIYTGAGG
jgi:hypothetical protein